MQKLIKHIVFSHRFYLLLILLLGGYLWYQECGNKQDELQVVLTQGLKESVQVLHVMHERMKGEIVTSSKDYPHAQGDHYCKRLLHLDQQSDTICQWITDGLKKKQRPYFPALKVAYSNHLELVKIYCDKDIEINKSLSSFNPEIAPFQKFDGAIFLSHAFLATVMNQVVSDNYFAGKVIGTSCGFDKYLAYMCIDQLNFQDVNQPTGEALLSSYSAFYYSTFFQQLTQQHLFLNNQEFPVKDGVAKFRYQFDTPGIHPLQVRWQYNHPETDSVTAFEKTYYVKVDLP